MPNYIQPKFLEVPDDIFKSILFSFLSLTHLVSLSHCSSYFYKLLKEKIASIIQIYNLEKCNLLLRDKVISVEQVITLQSKITQAEINNLQGHKYDYDDDGLTEYYYNSNSDSIRSLVQQNELTLNQALHLTASQRDALVKFSSLKKYGRIKDNIPIEIVLQFPFLYRCYQGDDEFLFAVTILLATTFGLPSILCLMLSLPCPLFLIPGTGLGLLILLPMALPFFAKLFLQAISNFKESTPICKNTFFKRHNDQKDDQPHHIALTNLV